jgi:SAM-dependent methyltransferase
MNRLCPICFSSDREDLYVQSFDTEGIFLMKGYNVVVCGKCGLAFANNIPSQKSFDRYYKIMSKYEFNYKDGIVSDDYIKHFSGIVNFISPFLKDKEAKILDIGCATGGLLSVFKLKGYKNLMGIDPSPSCVSAVGKLYGINASINNITNFDSNEKFDLIILSAVLEHLVDFKNSFKKIRSLLKNEGLLFISVPDVERFDLFVTAPFQQFSVEHINYFSVCSLGNLLSTFSFKEIKTKRNDSKLNQIIDPDIFSLSRKMKKNVFPFRKDEVSQLNIDNYIKKCFICDIGVRKKIGEKICSNKKIIVWGVGTHTQRLIGAGILSLSNILYFVDSNQRYFGKKIDGKVVKSPNEIREDNPILISSYSYQEEIENKIRGLSLSNKVIKIYEK